MISLVAINTFDACWRKRICSRLRDIPANTLVYRTRPEGHWCQHQWQVTNEIPARDSRPAWPTPGLAAVSGAPRRTGNDHEPVCDDPCVVASGWQGGRGMAGDPAGRTQAHLCGSAMLRWTRPPSGWCGSNVGATPLRPPLMMLASDLGWDDLQAQKYRAWEHQLALTILAAWFIAQVKLHWSHATSPAPSARSGVGN
jgi:hypothetical protein